LFGQPNVRKLHLIPIYAKNDLFSPMEIIELIKEAGSGSAAAEKCLFDHFAGPMMAICCRYLRRREDAEEALLDGFYQFFSHLPAFKFQGEAALYTWLKKIMIHQCLMRLRKKNIFSMLTETAAEDIVSGEQAITNLSAGEIISLIVQLPVGYRTVFNLYVIEGMEHKEIAKELGIAEGTSKSQLSKAKLLLQKLLMQKGIDYVRRKTQ
jgi:RNA polymerase sigma factor (sigma-70 family)